MIKIMFTAALLVSFVFVSHQGQFVPADTDTYAVADDNSCCRKP